MVGVLIKRGMLATDRHARRKGKVKNKENATEQRTKVTCLSQGMPKMAGRSSELQGARKEPPRTGPEGVRPCRHLDLSPQKREKTDFRGFKSPRWWHFVPAASGNCYALITELQTLATCPAGDPSLLPPRHGGRRATLSSWSPPALPHGFPKAAAHLSP